jgi:hypothetical protein
MRRLVWIDRGVLDDRLAGPGRSAASVGLHPADDRCRAIEEEIDVAVRRRFDPAEPFDRAQRRGYLLRDRSRRFAQAAGEAEGERDSEIPERAPGRELDGDVGQKRIVQGDTVQTADGIGYARTHEFVNRQNHEGSVIRGTIGRRPAVFMADFSNIIRWAALHDE